MAEQNVYNPATINRSGNSISCAVCMNLHSDDERNPPSLFKRMTIKDADKNYHIPDTVDGRPVVGFEDEWARGWSHHGYYSMGKNVCFIPFHFLNVDNQDPRYLHLPRIFTNDGGKRWRVDFYKKEILTNEPYRRMVRYSVYGGMWVLKDAVLNRDVEMFGFTLSSTDKGFNSAVAGQAGKGYKITKYHWNTETLNLLEGWRPCLVREDMADPFSITYDYHARLYD